MRLLNSAIREILGLFVDDEFLALATLLVVGATAMLVYSVAADAGVAGGALVVGCLVVLMAGVWRTARLRKRG